MNDETTLMSLKFTVEGYNTSQMRELRTIIVYWYPDQILV